MMVAPPVAKSVTTPPLLPPPPPLPHGDSSGRWDGEVEVEVEVGRCRRKGRRRDSRKS